MHPTKRNEVKNMTKWLLLVGLLTWAVPVQAMLTYNPEQSADRQLGFWDSNHNGSVEPSEYERLAAAKFDKIDSNDDDVITHAEMMSYRYARRSAASNKAKIRSVNNLMKRWDADGNLIISKDEYLGPVRADFGQLDLDNNQVISRDELVAHWRKKKQEIEQQQRQARHEGD
jgi:Ca2+-binding EF-hand superfamily protein